jgi:two-component system phosphate regulon sensor histidine kinase PhoR
MGLLVAGFTCLFIYYVGVSPELLLITFLASFSLTSIFSYLLFDMLIFQELNQIFDTLQQMRLKGFYLSKKKVMRQANPFKTINQELSEYAQKKENEISELKKTETFRREFLADVAHELKTPIFAAQGFVHTLIDGAVDDTAVRDKFLAKAAHSLDGLDNLVKNLMTIAQTEKGEVKLQNEVIDLEKLVEEVFIALEQKANKNQFKLKKQNLKSVKIVGDKIKLTQVFTNLTENAINYGIIGGELKIAALSKGEKWEIAVQDNGPGIPLEHQKRIFERFYRIEKSRSKELGGTGLGLAIVKHFLVLHKTKIGLISKPGKGCKFVFKLQKA